METIKLLTGVGSTVEGQIDGLRLQRHGLHNYTHYGESSLPGLPWRIQFRLTGGERLVWLCGKDTANINPEKPLKP